MITKKKVQRRRIQKLLDQFSGGSEFVTAPEGLPQETRQRIGRAVALNPDEDILLVGLTESESWCALTSDRLAWLQDGQLQALKWIDVRAVQQPTSVSAKIIRGEMRKDAASILEVIDSDERYYRISVMPGHSYFLLWNAILALCNHTRPIDPVVLE